MYSKKIYKNPHAMANYVRFDWMIKRLLRNKADSVVLEGFLSVLLERQITITNILESESNQDEDTQKFNRVDLLVEDENKAKYIIEVQNDHEIDFFQRMVFGTSKVIAQYTKLGEAYGKITKVYSINIVYFGLGQGKGYVYKGTTQFTNIFDKNDVLQLTPKQHILYNAEAVSDIFPEYYLLRVNNFDEYAISPLQQWISVLKTGDIPVEFTAQGLSEAREALNYNRLTDEEKIAYRRYLENLTYKQSMLETMDIMAHDKAIEKGRAEGAHSQAITIAKQMKLDSVPIDVISKYTQLSIDEIKSL